MTKVAMISINGAGNGGGVERVVDDHRRILGEEARVRLFCLPPSGWIARMRRVRVLNAPIMAAFPVVSSLLARAWAGRKGIVLSHGFSSTGLFCDAVFAHGCWAGFTRGTGTRMGAFGRMVFLYEWLSAHLAGKVVCVSDSVAEQWRQFYGLAPNRSAVLTNSVNAEVFRPVEGAKDPCTGDDLRVLFVGRFEAAKGLATLRRLHDEMVAAQESISVCVCSPSSIGEEVARRFPRFQFQCGLNSEQLVAEYTRADLFLLPSLYEGFEMSSIEALACGTPVILNDTGSRPTLEKLECPGVSRLEEVESPLQAVLGAAKKFRGIRREALAEWTRRNFGGQDLKMKLNALCGIEPAHE